MAWNASFGMLNIHFIKCALDAYQCHPSWALFSYFFRCFAHSAPAGTRKASMCFCVIRYGHGLHLSGRHPDGVKDGFAHHVLGAS